MEDLLKEEYNKESDAYIDYKGLSFKDGKFEEYLTVRVKDKFDDAEWNNSLITEAVRLTGFSDENLIGIFENKEKASCWRIGELVAECVRR